MSRPETVLRVRVVANLSRHAPEIEAIVEGQQIIVMLSPERYEAMRLAPSLQSFTDLGPTTGPHQSM